MQLTNISFQVSDFFFVKIPSFFQPEKQSIGLKLENRSNFKPLKTYNSYMLDSLFVEIFLFDFPF
jgi:hypothetical protein